MKKCYVPLLLLFFSAISQASDECISELSSSSNYADLNKIFACFNGKIKALEDKVEKLEAQPVKVVDNKTPDSNPPPTPKPTPAQTVEKGGVVFGLSQCFRKGEKNIVCEISVASNKDITLQVWVRHSYSNTHRTTGIATSGIQYVATSASLGASGQNEELTSYRMVSGLPLTLLINFSSIPSSEKGFPLLEVTTNEVGQVQFRDVQFTDQ